MKFRVVVKNTEGVEETKVIEATSRFDVYSQVEKEGASVISIQEGAGGLPKWTQISIGTGINTQTRITFTKNLAAMLSAGLTLSRALSVIERQTTNKSLKQIVVDLELKIKSGTSFHEALELHNKVFPKLFIAMTKAGEEGGTLSETLRIVAKQMDTSDRLIKKVKGAMIYPSIILFAIFVIGILMLLFVVPTLSSTFGQLGAKLPATTLAIMAASNFMIHHIVIALSSILILVVGGVFFVRSKVGGTAVLWAALHMPVVGELVQETFSARASRTLASLLTSGVEMLTALSITQEVVGENVFGKVIGEAEQAVRKGEPLSAAFANHLKLYPVFMGDMIAVGEETGKVSEMLTQVAEYYEIDVEDRTKDLSTIIEPVLMLIIGVFVGVFAVSMIAPIYSLSSQI